MKSTPSSTARRSTAIASSWSRGGPQIPSPVMRIAPKPSRLTLRAPAMSYVVDMAPNLPASGRNGPRQPEGIGTRLRPCRSGRRRRRTTSSWRGCACGSWPTTALVDELPAAGRGRHPGLRLRARSLRSACCRGWPRRATCASASCRWCCTTCRPTPSTAASGRASSSTCSSTPPTAARASAAPCSMRSTSGAGDARAASPHAPRHRRRPPLYERLGFTPDDTWMQLRL